MDPLRDLPIRQKLRITSMLSSGVALLLACVAFVSYESLTYKDALIADLSSAAAIVGFNSSAALLFADPDSAARTLQSLSTHENIVGATLFDREGAAFAHYSRPGLGKPYRPPAVDAAGYSLQGDRISLFLPFELAGEPAGTVHIESDTQRLKATMARYAVIGLLVMLVSSGTAFLLSAKLQRSISSPISHLASVVGIVRTQNDYSVRATAHGRDELGNLIDGFNAMLDQIQAQDNALLHAREHLERRVADRTRELEQEIHEREAAQAQLEQIHGQLLDASRRAGMAEVATNVLHNVGNVLNSVNVSASVISEQVEQSRAKNLSRIAAMLDEQGDAVGAFLTQDPRGKHVRGYLTQVSEHLAAERAAMLKELASLRNNIDHIKGIVTMQQSHARVSGVKESVPVVDLVEAALHINSASLQRHEVEIVREYESVPPLTSEKHKVLQILVNLVRNAKDACKASSRNDKRVWVRVVNGNGSVKITVADNGVGIAAENMNRIFAHGFTTKVDGHGFGLHSGALAARELGGSLLAQSDGLDRGTQFTLELPIEPPQPADAQRS
jgi:C4-dicarboxylate-specific signal transduction histidine kinase